MSPLQRARALAFFKLQRLIGSRCEEYYREFLRAEHWSVEELARERETRLDRLLRQAAQAVPFYRERVRTVDRLTLAGFPILTKQDVREHFLDLMTEPLRAAFGTRPGGVRSYGWTKVKTGGSTGMPTTVIHDAEFRDRGRAARLYSQRLSGFPFGVPYVRLWGAMQDVNRMKDSLPHRIMSALSGERVLNAFRMDNASMGRHLERLNALGFDHMMAYVDAAEALARHSVRTGQQPRPLRSIMACAGTVTAEARTLLRQVFGARTHNNYGSRDCAAMACECEAGGLHVYEHHLLIEIVDDGGQPLPLGETGRILVTLLSNHEFPLIRYEIGDMGALSRERCACGRPFRLLARVEGRQTEFLRAVDGGHVSPVYIRHLLGVVHNPGLIRRFQVVQERRTHCQVLLEPEEGARRESLSPLLEVIERDLKVAFGAGCEFKFQVVERIPETATGKFLYCINQTGDGAS